MHGDTLRSNGAWVCRAIPFLVLATVATCSWAQWWWPRHDPRNTACAGRPADLQTKPVLRWSYAPSQGGPRGSYLSVGDLNGDGQPEIAVGSGPLGPGEEGVGWLWALDSMGNLVWEARLDGYVKWASPVMVWLDRDGMLDVVVGASWWSSLFAFRGYDGAPLWAALGGLCQVGMNAADLDGDGLAEIVVADYQNPRHVRMLNPDGSVRWILPTSGTTYNIPAMGHLGDSVAVAFTAHDPPWRERLYVVGPEGNVRWTFRASPSPEQLEATPPQLGYLADYGYTSAVLADFDGDGSHEVGFGTDLNYYVLEPQGTLRWRSPTGILGTGFTAVVDQQGDTLSCVDHHYQVFDAAVADLNADGACDVVLGLCSDWWGYQLQGDPASLVVTHVVFRNAVVALNGPDGALLWEFRGRTQTLDPHGRGRMYEPVACLIDGQVAILVASNDGYLYALRGSDGGLLWDLWGGGEYFRRGMALADLTGDNLDELVVVRGSAVEVYSALAPPSLTVTATPQGVLLSWSGDAATREWRVYRAWNPWGQPHQVVFLPASQTWWLDPAEGVLGNPEANAFYWVVASRDATLSLPSAPGGEVDWELDTGIHHVARKGDARPQ